MDNLEQQPSMTPTRFERVGGEEALERAVDIFCHKVRTD